MKEEYVFNIDEIPNNDDSLLGVVVDIKRKWNKQRHCGIAFNLHGKPQVLHLATHKEVLCDKDLKGFLCWVRPSMHPAQQQVFCSYLELLGEAVEQGKTDIPYGFLYDDYARIESDGTLFLGGKECGLTCATFVLTLFHSQGIDLVDLNSWDSREEDKPWFIRIINLFIKHFIYEGRMTRDHFKRLLSEIGCPRYRPEEIAVSSALYKQEAAGTEEIRIAGSNLLDYLLEITKS